MLWLERELATSTSGALSLYLVAAIAGAEAQGNPIIQSWFGSTHG